MLVMHRREDFPDRKVEPLKTRMQRQAAEGIEARRDYKEAQAAAIARIAGLRAARLARDAAEKK